MAFGAWIEGICGGNEQGRRDHHPQPFPGCLRQLTTIQTTSGSPAGSFLPSNSETPKYRAAVAPDDRPWMQRTRQAPQLLPRTEIPCGFRSKRFDSIGGFSTLGSRFISPARCPKSPPSNGATPPSTRSWAAAAASCSRRPGMRVKFRGFHPENPPEPHERTTDWSA